MSGSHFIFKSRRQLKDLKEGDRIEESDFSTLDEEGNFYQFEHKEVEEDLKREPYPVKPGIFTMIKTSVGMQLLPSDFTTDKILEEFVSTREIEDKVDCFFRRLDVYKKLGIEVPKRAALLYGPAGSGKSSSLIKICKKYVADSKTVIIVWPTSVIEPYDVKEFFKSFEYKGVEKVIFVIEDVGGIEVEERRIASDPALLSLLDNKEKTFTVPTFILATTNYPNMFMANLGNRPDRFDDKIEVGFPKEDAREGLLKFFALEPPTPEDIKHVRSVSCTKFTPAHIREIVIRSGIYEKTMLQTMKELKTEIDSYETGFAAKRQATGFGMNDD